MNQAQFAAALLDAALPVPEGVTSARGEVDPVRFAVYRNNIAVSLSKALRQRFPVTRRLVGDAFFDGMARAYMAVSLPESPLIFAYGDTFPDFIGEFRPAAGLPYLADTARLEAHWTRAYHGADGAPLSARELATVAPDRLGRTRLLAHPSASLVRSPFAVGTIWQAHQHAHVPAIDVNAKENVLVTRPELEVRVHVIPEADADFAGALLAGASLDEAAKAALATDAGFDFGRAMVGLVCLGAFAGIASLGGPR